MTVICTIGDLILDVVVLPRAPLLPDGDTPATIRLSAGGQAANVAAWSASLGAHGRLICARGSGRAAIMAESDLDAHGVEVVGPQNPGAGGVVVSTRGPDGARTMASDPGAAASLSPADVDPDWVAFSDVLHVSGYCLLREAMADAAIAAARSAAAGHGTRVSLDLASAHDIALLGVERFSERVGRLNPTVIFANEAERAAVGDLGPSLAHTRWVIKRGARGASFPEGERSAEPGEVIDTTGAGDALAAGYLVGGPELAMIAAARCVAQVGAMPRRLGAQDELS